MDSGGLPVPFSSSKAVPTRHGGGLRNIYVLINFVINNKIWIIPWNIPTPLLTIKYAEIQGLFHIKILPFCGSYCCYTISMK